MHHINRPDPVMAELAVELAALRSPLATGVIGEQSKGVSA